MLVIGLSLSILRYLWSFSRSRQRLPWHRYFCPRKLGTNPPYSHGATVQCIYSCALGIVTSGHNLSLEFSVFPRTYLPSSGTYGMPRPHIQVPHRPIQC
jgi:hypothetical protein